MFARPPLVLPLTALAGFLLLFGLVLGDWPPLARADAAFSESLRDYAEASPGLVEGFRVATDVAATVPFVAVGLATALLLGMSGQRHAALFSAAVTGSVPALWGLMHWLLHRPRPRNGFVDIDSNGFPSGHTTMATAAALTAVLLLWPRLRSAARLATALLAAGFAGFIGLTRLVLLAHWPVDVLGGWLLALAVVPLAARAVERLVSSPPRPVGSTTGAGRR